jgi:peptidoglycan/LPS O-acetylase OafA/YrhL
LNLRRITTSGNWIPEVDGLRFVAISATVLVHIIGETFFRSGHAFSDQDGVLVRVLVDRGSRGVQLFFAISGFILAQPFLRQHLLRRTPVSVSAFYRRRLTRLEPPYILSLLIYAVALSIRGGFDNLGPSLLSHILYVNNWTNLEPISFVAWSLEVEVQFYLLAPLLGCLYAIRGALWRRGTMILLIAGSAAFSILNPYSRFAYDLPGELQFFMVVFLLADLRAGRTESTASWKWDVMGSAAWFAIFALPTAYIYGLSPLILLAYMSVFDGPVLRQFFRKEWIAITGGMCYSFYLMHMLVISTVFRITKHLVVSDFFVSLLIQVLLLGGSVCVCCTGYYIVIERPCMDPQWPRKLLARIDYLRSRSKASTG